MSGNRRELTVSPRIKICLLSSWVSTPDSWKKKNITMTNIHWTRWCYWPAKNRNSRFKRRLFLTSRGRTFVCNVKFCFIICICAVDSITNTGKSLWLLYFLLHDILARRVYTLSFVSCSVLGVPRSILLNTYCIQTMQDIPHSW